MKWSPRRSLAVMALAGLLVLPPLAHAGLGQIQVLSEGGDKFAALIPFVDAMPGDAVTVSLADRNRYPLLSPYSASADQLTFTLQRSLDGTPTGVLVLGPAKFSEAELHFAVAMSWASGGAVREYQVDYRHPGPRSKSPASPREQDKKSLLSSHLASPAGNLGLGALKISSQPGQPLVAEMDVFGSGVSLEKLQVLILPEHAPAADQTDWAKLVASMRYILVRAPSGTIKLQLTSNLPVSSPSLGFRLELSQGGVQMARRYQLEAHGSEFSVVEQTVSGRRTTFKVLRVLPGDSLSAIASRLRHDGLSSRDVIERLYQENPQAFIAGDINRLLAGARLKYPGSWKLGGAAAAGQEVPPPAPRTQDASEAARQVKEAALQEHLRQQEKLLAQAQQLSNSLEGKLRDLREKPKHAPAQQRPVPPVVSPVPAHKPVAPVSRPATSVAEGSVALIAAAAATALALRRRRLRRIAEGKPDADTAPTAEGMRQWLRYDPTRNDLRFRLLQLLASQDDREAYLVEVEQARVHFDEDGPLWRGTVAMGRVLAPDYPWPDFPLEPVSAGDQPDAAASESAQEPVEATAVVSAPVAEKLPERPLMVEQELDALAEAPVEFREPAPVVVADPPVELDKRELAKLYLEMGDAETARELMQTQHAA